MASQVVRGSVNAPGSMILYSLLADARNEPGQQDAVACGTPNAITPSVLEGDSVCHKAVGRRLPVMKARASYQEIAIVVPRVA